MSALFSKFSKTKESAPPFEDLFPFPTVEHETDEDDMIVILRPRFQAKFLVKHLVPRLPTPYVRITLDEMGSFVWRRLDGEHRIADILKEMEGPFADPVTGLPMMNLSGRLEQFLRQLARHDLVRFHRKLTDK
ncbi:MAG: PqqD family protein [Deltaproteobacteria bacterium]|nr:PqqD family protein [Deltaproteobacteria bacterium]